MALTDGALQEAATHLHTARTTFATMPAHFEVARTHLALAVLAQHQEAPAAMDDHRRQAQRLCPHARLPEEDTTSGRAVTGAREEGA